MSAADPLEPLLTLGNVAQLATTAVADVARVHRRPAALRKTSVIASESALRGARLSTLIDGHPAPTSSEPDGAFGRAVSVYSLLAPDRVGGSVSTLLRAPLQIAARMDVLAGGEGRPVTSDGAARLRSVGAIVTHPRVNPALATQVVHLEVASREVFGERSGLVARAASRLMAVASGFDPSGIAVPEVHLHRHARDYREALARWREGDAATALEFLLSAWIAGAAEGDAITRAA